MAGRPKGIAAKGDRLAAILILMRLGWSDRSIAKALKCSPTSIPIWRAHAKDAFEAGELDIDRRMIVHREFAVGDSSVCERLAGFYSENPCGGGREITNRNHNSDSESDERW